MKCNPIVAVWLLGAFVAYGFPPSTPEQAAGGDAVDFWVTNDALGSVPVDEWDDLATVAFGASFAVGRLIGIHASYEMFTCRACASRIDATRALVALETLEAQAGAFHLFLTPAAGMRLFGNLGGVSLQGGFHGSVGVERPVPVSYDSYRGGALAVSLAGGISVEEWAPVVPELFGVIEGSLPGTWRVEAGASATFGGLDAEAVAQVAYRCQTEAGLSPTLDAVSRGDSGMLVGVGIGVGHFSSSTEHNLSRGTSKGSFSIGMGPSRVAARDGGLSVALELCCDVVPIALGRRVLVPIGNEHLRASAGAAMGWWCPSFCANGYKFCDYSAGVEGRESILMGILEAEVACGVGPALSVVTVQPIGMESSKILDHSLLVSARIEPTLRLGFVEDDRAQRHVITGIGAKLSLSVSRWVVVPFSSSALPGRGPVTLTVFAFSEAE